MEAKQIKVNNTNIAFYDEGQGETIVLIHGFCGSKDYWEKVIPDISGQYRVIAIDLLGHGGSSLLDGVVSVEGMAEGVKGVLDELALEKISLFGHSLGGYVALAFAEANGDRLNRFGLIHSTANPDSDEAKKGREEAADKIKTEGIKPFIDGLVPKLFSPEHLEEHTEEVQRAKEIGYDTDPKGALSALKAMKDRPDRNHILENTELPVLIIAGEDDQVIKPDKSFTVTGPSIQQAVIPNAGHMSMYENPDELINKIRQFMET